MAADFIKDANSIEQIVDGINTTEASSEVKYFGEYKLDSGEKLAAHYAYEQVANYEHISDDEIKTHLQELKSKDAHFDMNESLQIAKQFCSKCET
ncbi:hypothetical protein [Methylophaga nitratireducenticrescens]|uniref:Uncharacterized protein n=1 Tax=Methylophaga nitratireducenticrescens TaxID=754476 RepID=I1XK42_METNJ|nr:hypothetical protein [Methylophaga nitratireducenticrescens]AFI84761.1 hypothetical protein Q7A_1944 [Methylophaga nitratireducenticrescens]AUZ84809.1 hypothetical protein CDW43_09575 [Methylophaga nitratireducenticrescens]